ncbi:MAG: hypothetical protein M3077_07635 [Candidatus Dormibacteraeota bacterium]|nr:hypothetical protein [Candidatus Dormibacteraeota bacterium]MDQ6884092.1 hypothetical protein [Candidatus Dormibacteraeota bacterium]
MRKPNTEPDIPLEAVQALLTRVIWQAVADIGIPAYREEADRFFAGDTFDEYCDILGWNARRARASLTRFVDSGARISGNHLMTAAELVGARVPGAQAVAS